MKRKEAVLEYVSNNPNASVSNIAKACNTSVSYAYKVVTGYKKPSQAKPAKKRVVFTADFSVDQPAPKTYSQTYVDTLLEEVDCVREREIKAMKIVSKLNDIICYLEDRLFTYQKAYGSQLWSP